MAIYSTEMQRYWQRDTYNSDNRNIPVICVNGETLDNRYSRGLKANSDSAVVVDSSTGLMWQDTAENARLQFGWKQAIDYCENLEHAGFADWRLPNVNELSYALPNQTFVHQTSLPELAAGRSWSPGVDFRRPYWASTPNVMSADKHAWAMESIGYSYERYEHQEQYYARCVRTDLTRNSSPYVFDRAGRHIRTLDQTSGVTLLNFTYDPSGRLASIKDRFSNALMIERNADGRAVALTTSDGHVTRLQVDQQQDLRSVQYADTSSYQFSYQLGLLTDKRDPNGHLFSRVYDQYGRIRSSDDSEGGIWRFFSQQDPGSKTLSYGYTTAENNRYESQIATLLNGDKKLQTRFTDASSQQRTSSADGLRHTYLNAGVQSEVETLRDPLSGQPIPAAISNTLPSGLQQQTLIRKQYGANGTDTARLTVTIASNGKVSMLQNDAISGLKKVQTAAKREVLYQYEPATLLLSSVSVSGLTAEHYRYDSRGRVTEIRQSERVSQFAYGPHGKGNVTAVTDAEGYTTSYEYDDMGRLVLTRYPDGQELQLSYDRNGNVASLTPPGQPAHLFHYNGVGNAASYTPPVVTGAAQPATHYQYDRDRKLLGVTRPDLQKISLQYGNSDSQLQSMQTPHGLYQYSYNADGLLAGLLAPSGISNSYSYDGDLPLTEGWNGAVSGQVSQRYNSDFAVTEQCINNGHCVSYSYDADGLITAAGELALTPAAQQAGVLLSSQLAKISTANQYNGFAELTGSISNYQNQPLHQMTLQRDKLGRISHKTEVTGNSTVSSDYFYNGNGRLYKVVRNGETIEYTFDGNGNRLTKTDSSGSRAASYDAQDRLVSDGDCQYSYTANGELLQKQCGSAVTAYQYDVLGNLLHVTPPDSGQGVKTIDYLVDGHNRRVGKKVGGVLQQGWLYAGQLSPVAELDGNQQVVARFVYGSKSNVPDYLVKGGVTYRIITDQLGSVRLVVNSQTGVIAQQLSYDEFGVVLQDSIPGFQHFVLQVACLTPTPV